MSYNYGQNIMDYSADHPMSGSHTEYPNTHMRALHDSKILRPSEKFFFADGVSSNLTKDRSMAYTGETPNGNTIAYRHPGQTTNAAFFDGHCQRMSIEDLGVPGYFDYHKNWGPYDD
jgi:prepilin-type processing-associated H-X9-DG protein